MSCRLRAVLGVLLFSLALFVSGCGGGASSSSSSSSTVIGVPDLGSPPGPPDPAQALRGASSPAIPVALTVAEGQVSGTLPLVQGWNLVSFPVARVTALQPGPGVYETGYRWDPAGGTYRQVALRNTDSVASDLGTGCGLWVYSDRASQVGYTGRPNSGTATDSEVTLGQGWNLLGLPYDHEQAFFDMQVQGPGAASPVQSLMDAVSRTSPRVLLHDQGFTYDGQGYRSASLSAAGGAFPVGLGMWVYVYEAGTLLRFAEAPSGVALTPATASVRRVGDTIDLNCLASGQPVENLTFHWTCTASMGLIKDGSGQSGNDLVTQQGTISYEAVAPGTGSQDVVAVTVRLGGVEVGRAQTTIVYGDRACLPGSWKGTYTMKVPMADSGPLGLSFVESSEPGKVIATLTEAPFDLAGMELEGTVQGDTLTIEGYDDEYGVALQMTAQVIARDTGLVGTWLAQGLLFGVAEGTLEMGLVGPPVSGDP